MPVVASLGDLAKTRNPGATPSAHGHIEVALPCDEQVMRGKHGLFWASLSTSDGTLTAIEAIMGVIDGLA